MIENKKVIKFVDLFCGIGAFHQSIKNIFPHSKCVVAVDNDYECEEIYKLNYQKDNYLFLKDINDPNVINKLINKNINYNLLTAGFPCTPFSSAGKRNGFLHSEGKLFNKVIEIIKKYNENHKNKEIKVILLENVAYLAQHDNKNTWKKIKTELEKLNYFVKDTELIVNPLHINIPQNRKRLFFIAFHKTIAKKENFKLKLNSINWKLKKVFDIKINKTDRKKNCNLISFFNKNYHNAGVIFLENEKVKILEIWQQFLEITNLKNNKIGFPIWLDFFEIENKIPEYSKLNWQKWKKSFYFKNKNFYFKNKRNIDFWWRKNKEILLKKKTYRKFEWNSGNEIKSIEEGIIQFRHSGIRIKKPDFFPALVKMSSIPIFYDNNLKKFRYLHFKEAAYNLQSFDEKTFKYFPKNMKIMKIFQKIGNSINVKILNIFLNFYKELIEL